MALNDRLFLPQAAAPVARLRREKARPRLARDPHARQWRGHIGTLYLGPLLVSSLLRYRRLGTYIGAGVASGVANLALFHIAVRMRVTPHLAWALAFEAGALLAFILHRHVTWRDHRVRSALGTLRQLWRAQAGSLLALLVNLVIFTALVRAGLPSDLDDALGLAAGFALNYVLAHHFIYGSPRLHGWTPRRHR
jgi:putative flippase GtrA